MMYFDRPTFSLGNDTITRFRLELMIFNWTFSSVSQVHTLMSYINTALNVDFSSIQKVAKEHENYTFSNFYLRSPYDYLQTHIKVSLSV